MADQNGAPIHRIIAVDHLQDRAFAGTRWTAQHGAFTGIEFKIHALHDRQFNAAVLLPRDFDNRKRYPVMVDVYGGPHSIYVIASRQRWLLNQWYADQGFIVVCIDGRGTPGRGVAWERAIYQKFGSVPLDDQVAGLQALAAKHPAMDLGRVGIKGWSFGGYAAEAGLAFSPELYRCGVAGAGVSDLIAMLEYEAKYGGQWLGDNDYWTWLIGSPGPDRQRLQQIHLAYCSISTGRSFGWPIASRMNETPPSTVAKMATSNTNDVLR